MRVAHVADASKLELADSPAVVYGAAATSFVVALLRTKKEDNKFSFIDSKYPDGTSVATVAYRTNMVLRIFQVVHL